MTATATASALDRSAVEPEETRAGRNAKYVVVAAWLVIMALLLRHREVISSDTLSNYIHVWFVADRLWHGHGLPFHMPVLAHGHALAFPYGFIPWMFAVLLWPLMGEWSVTLTLGVGFVGLVAATFWAFPELRRGWWAVAALVNPAFVEGLLLGQLPFLWSAAMLVVAIGCWRRGNRTPAIVLAALAQITHAAILIPLTALLVLWWRPYEEDKRGLVRAWVFATIPALPAAALVFLSPVTAHTSPLYSLWIEVETLVLRSLVLVVPIGLVALQRRSTRVSSRAAVVAAAAMVIGQAVTIPISGMGVGWGALTRTPDGTAAGIPHTSVFRPGMTYRVLTFGDAKYGQYAVVRAGGHLDSEFFPESLYRGSFKNEQAYAHFLKDRGVDVVIVDRRYSRFRTNEPRLLAQMASASGDAACIDGVQVKDSAETEKLIFYKIIRGCSAPTPTS